MSIDIWNYQRKYSIYLLKLEIDQELSYSKVANIDLL